ncbi:MAG TPA: ATP-binding protein [Ktedonobacteraceae bacterium]|nr:ATP-binding protein [Ktedonobacteraceae bacterium]
MNYIPRALQNNLDKLLNDKKIVILLGARQVGKTTLMKPFVREHNGLMLNCDIEVDKAQLLAAATLSPLEAIQLLGNPSLLVIDEAQNLPQISRIVKGWYDADVPTKIVLLGSSSLNLLDQMAEPLTGRNEKIYLTPLLFTEVLRSRSWYTPSITKDMLQNQFAEQVQTLLLQQMVYGSYPEAVTTDDKEKYLLNLTSDYLLRDILQSGLVKSPEMVKRLLSLLAYQAGSEVSTTEIANRLQASRQTVENYIELLERSYVIFRVRAFSTNQRKEIAKSSKIFFWDTGIRNALLKEFSLSPLRSDIGSLFENWAIAEVAKINMLSGDRNTLYFWRRVEGSKVDLIVRGSNTFKAYELKWSKATPIPSSRSFSSTYDIPIQVLTRGSILDLLWSEGWVGQGNNKAA